MPLRRDATVFPYFRKGFYAMVNKLAAFVLAVNVLAAPVHASQPDAFTNWPQGTDPNEVGSRLANHFATSGHQYLVTTFHYAEVLAWYGALRFADTAQDNALRGQLVARFDPILPGHPEAKLVPGRAHVDDSVFGVLPMEIGYQTHDATVLAMGESFADRQWASPRPDGLTAESRFWVDDMFMITALQMEAYRVTGDRKYLDRTAREMVVYLDKLQQPNGIFFHGTDVPIAWSRGNGWAAAGLACLLEAMPATHPDRPRILAGYRKFMAELLVLQGKDGMWRQVLDDDEAWPETSGSAMFTYAMVLGVKHGWLDTSVYGPAARHAWIALTGYLDQNDNLTNVCEGTNKRNDLNFYLMRRRLTGDFHGQAPMLWIAAALVSQAR
jgi:rhamnogalacturonyl hydrolase YesR